MDQSPQKIVAHDRPGPGFRPHRGPAVAAVALLVVSAVPGWADPSMWYLERRGYWQPVIADVRGNSNTIGLPFATYFKTYEYANPTGALGSWPMRGARDGVDIALGKELALLGMEHRPAPVDVQGEEAGVRDAGNRWQGSLPGASYRGMGVWTYMHWHMLGDLLAPSAPLVNNDYRIGGAINGMWQPADRIALRGSFKAGHESSHLGDELTLANAANPSFMRVNVSYEFLDAGLGCTLVVSHRDAGRLTAYGLRSIGLPFAVDRRLRRGETGGEVTLELRAGTMFLLAPDRHGFYAYDLAETHQQALRRSQDTNEHYLQASLTESHGGSKWFVSADLRRRIIFRYLPAGDLSREGYAYSTNVMVGIKDFRDPAVSQLASLYVRYYRGVNPNGQFQNQERFWLLGPGISFDL